nr:3-ketoacyl-CoA thiolase 2, peroxisomal [Tanacetum cinerariifolium]
MKRSIAFTIGTHYPKNKRLCKLKRGGLKDTYPDEILAPVLKVKTMAEAQDCLLPMGVTSENVSQRLGMMRKEQDQATCVFSVERMLWLEVAGKGSVKQDEAKITAWENPQQPKVNI